MLNSGRDLESGEAGITGGTSGKKSSLLLLARTMVVNEDEVGLVWLQMRCSIHRTD